MGRACPVGEAASQKPQLPHPNLQADPATHKPKPSQVALTVHPSSSQGTQLPAGPGGPPSPAPVLLPHGAWLAHTAAPESCVGSGCAGEAEVEEFLIFQK